MTNSGNYTTYHYDGEGKRTQKIINGEAHTFIWVGDKIVQENYPGVEKKFFYDAQGRPDHFTCNGDLYYYVLNIMGDVTGVLDSNGNECGSYLYDAWGKTVYQSGIGADLNPIRYRSYFYDGDFVLTCNGFVNESLAAGLLFGYFAYAIRATYEIKSVVANTATLFGGSLAFRIQAFASDLDEEN